MAAHNELGRWGEDMAAKYMEERGWYVRHRDWRYDHKDLDLVCIDADDTTIVVVEVKTRSTDEYGRPAEAVDLEKRSNIISCAGRYMHDNRKENRYLRFDIISIVGTPDTGFKLEHVEDAFTPAEVYIQKLQNLHR